MLFLLPLSPVLLVSKNSILQKCKYPLFEVRFELDDEDTYFHPSLGYGVTNGLYDLVESLIDDVYGCAKLVPRVTLTHAMAYNVSRIIPKPMKNEHA